MVATAFLSDVVGMAGGLILVGVLLALLPVPDAMVLHALPQIASNLRCGLLWWRHVRWAAIPGLRRWRHDGARRLFAGAAGRPFCRFAAHEPTPERTAFVRFRRALLRRRLERVPFDAVTRRLEAEA